MLGAQANANKMVGADCDIAANYIVINAPLRSRNGRYVRDLPMNANVCKRNELILSEGWVHRQEEQTANCPAHSHDRFATRVYGG